MNMADSDDGYQSQRESHYNQQRSSLRSERSSRGPSRPQSSGTLIHDYTLPADYGNLNEAAAPSPVQSRGEGSRAKHASSEGERRYSGRSTASWGSRRNTATRAGRSNSRLDEVYNEPASYGNLNEVMSEPVENPHERPTYQHTTLEQMRTQSRDSHQSRRSKKGWRSRPGSQQAGALALDHPPSRETNVTALPQVPDSGQSQNLEREERNAWDDYVASKSPRGQQVSRFATQLYTISYLILFSILGTLARLGLQWMTFYPGAPVNFSVLWANFAGTLFMGFLAEDRRLFRDEWGKLSNSRAHLQSDEEKAVDMSAAKASHAKAKKTIPLYIGLATGFCGSFTSFSSFMRDVFFALSNDMPSPINHPSPGISVGTSSTVHRNGGYSFEALLAVIIITVALCYSALKIGAHVAIVLDPFMPMLPFNLMRKVCDRAVVFVAFGAWLGAVFMAIWPPDRPGGPDSRGSWMTETWRGEAIFACVFAPLGCLIRFYASLKLNGLIPSFPLGTFCVNVFGTAVLGMAFDLQHVRIGNTALAGGGRVGCQVLQGIMDGFCGTLTTVSTWIAEINSLRRSHSYIYGGTSVLSGLSILIIVMGSVRWTVGWTTTACVT